MKNELKQALLIWGEESPPFKEKCEEIKSKIGHTKFINIYNELLIWNTRIF